jgi:hypothetical protein
MMKKAVRVGSVDMTLTRLTHPPGAPVCIYFRGRFRVLPYFPQPPWILLLQYNLSQIMTECVTFLVLGDFTTCKECELSLNRSWRPFQRFVTYSEKIKFVLCRATGRCIPKQARWVLRWSTVTSDHLKRNIRIMLDCCTKPRKHIS